MMIMRVAAASLSVIPGLDPGIRSDWVRPVSCGLMPGSSPGMTVESVA